MPSINRVPHSSNAEGYFDTIKEQTVGNGVNIDGVVCKDGRVTVTNGIIVGTMLEATSGSGVAIDGVVAKDSAVLALKPISEAASATLTAAQSGTVFFINSDTTAADFVLPAPSAGITFKWIWTDNCNNAITISTADSTDTTGDMFVGALMSVDTTDAVSILELADSSDLCKLTFDDNVANSAGGAGQWVEVVCTEDARWFVHGWLNSTSDTDTDLSGIASDVDA